MLKLEEIDQQNLTYESSYCHLLQSTWMPNFIILFKKIKLDKSKIKFGIHVDCNKWQ